MFEVSGTIPPPPAAEEERLSNPGAVTGISVNTSASPSQQDEASAGTPSAAVTIVSTFSSGCVHVRDVSLCPDSKAIQSVSLVWYGFHTSSSDGVGITSVDVDWQSRLIVTGGSDCAACVWSL